MTEVQDIVSRSRELGRARLEVAAECQSAEDWRQRWRAPVHGFPFAWGPCWKHTVEYHVADFAAEVGFYLDLLGFDCNALAPDYCMVMGPLQEFYLSFRPCAVGEAPTAVEALSLQFMVDGIETTAADLEGRGIELAQPVEPYGGEDSPMRTCRFHSPAGLELMLWGMV